MATLLKPEPQRIDVTPQPMPRLRFFHDTIDRWLGG
jgi:hypothetical protein